MKLTLLPALFLLSGCATILTPERCAGFDAAAASVQDIAAYLIEQGVEPVKAAKIAGDAKAAQEAVRAACERANRVVGI
jgi:outer membrane murein-binding lipoprotein Lpp